VNFFSGTPGSNRHELRLHLNVMPTSAGVFKSRHILLVMTVAADDSQLPLSISHDYSVRRKY
jgi:hypothetical protein